MSRLNDLRMPSIAVRRAEAFAAWCRRHEDDNAPPDNGRDLFDMLVAARDEARKREENEAATLRLAEAQKRIRDSMRERDHEESHGKGWGSIGLPGPIPVDAGEPPP